MIRLRSPAGLAGPMSRRPLTVALVATLICLLGLVGLLRFGVSAGEDLLVGSSSQAGRTYASFSNDFGSDPIVIVFTASNPTAPYQSTNLQRLAALELDLANDPRVASVMGPGTVAVSVTEAANNEVSKLEQEYPAFVADTTVLAHDKAGMTAQQLQQLQQTYYADAQEVLAAYAEQAAVEAYNVRAAFKYANGERIIDAQEHAVDTALEKQQAPPLFAEYLAGPAGTANATTAQQTWARLIATYGECDSTIAQLLKITPDCQPLYDRTLLDLPNCPLINTNAFCDPKTEWAAVFPTPQPGGDSREILTIRLKPQAASDSSKTQALTDEIEGYLAHGIGNDAYTRSLPSTVLSQFKALGPLDPSECAGVGKQADPTCYADFNDAPFSYVVAGSPLLAQGVTRQMSVLLAILLPIALLLMALILIGVFRVRGRVLPLVAALAASILTVGLLLLIGLDVTPAVLAGIPVLLGLGVDYAVQLVARYQEQREAGNDAGDALRTVLRNTGGVTATAAFATVVGLAALLVVSGVDLGPLNAVPLVAEFALSLSIGVVIAWCAALFVALPLAVWSDKRRPILPSQQHEVVEHESRRSTSRTLAIADNLRGVLAIAVVTGLAGWVLLGRVPVQTDVQSLLAPSLPELAAIETVQAETGFTNEVDLYLQGQVATGPLDTSTGTPIDVEWQCEAAAVARSQNADQVVSATSVGDFVVGQLPSTSASSTQPECALPASSPSSSPAPSAGPSSSASPTAFRVHGAASAQEDAASSTPSATTSAAASAAASPGATPSPTPSPQVSTQTPFLCELRLFPVLSRTLVAPIGLDASPCPPVDEYTNSFLAADPSPIDPTSARIAIGVHSTSIAAEAALVTSLKQDVSSPPNGMQAAPAGLAVLVATAYSNIVNEAYLLNLVPLVLVAVALLVVYREPRRALLPVLPTALAAGWAPLILLLLGRFPGSTGQTLGSFNPLTVVMGSLVVALATEFGVVLLGRFYEERRRGLDPDLAALAALGGVGRAIRVSALTLGAGFAVLALSGVLPNSLPLLSDFGLVVVLDLALAVLAVFGVMLPAAVVLERRSPMRFAAAAAPFAASKRGDTDQVAAPQRAEPKPADAAAPAATPAAEPRPTAKRHAPGVSGRRRQAAPSHDDDAAPVEELPQAPRRPGVSGRPRRTRR